MGVYVNDSKRVSDPLKPAGHGGGWVLSYMVDTPADLANLPGIDKINGSSTALILSTGQVKVLTETGWDKDL
jgi:hypothetical protein